MDVEAVGVVLLILAGVVLAVWIGVLLGEDRGFAMAERWYGIKPRKDADGRD